ncbi:hypothetical protein IMCC3317_24820 [Kordia antarctica]|uniref:Uncharacterized protein n=1 Tax=Kordia antarctica TaxID=1218801 RepID=A0A7L4ZME8_9FLAO|nr:hypothetical protein [Kordia antarctica]QHI37104.1 hypothetical protein IMCC3317_24820 [Kordia antarctica]
MIKNKQTKRKSILDGLDLNSIPKSTKPLIDKKKVLKHPVTKLVICGIAIYGILKVSKYFVNGYAELIRATKNLRKARSQ